jgi:Flagellar basal body protein FlaE
MALSLLVAAGCDGPSGSQRPIDGGTDVQGGPTAGSVQLSLAPGPHVPIMVDLLGTSTVDLLVKDESDAHVLAVTQIDYPGKPNSFLYGLCTDDCEGLPLGAYSALPTGTYTLEVSAKEPLAYQFQCSYVPAAPTRTVTLLGNLDPMGFPTEFDTSSPKTTSDFTTSLTVYTALGYATELDIYFVMGDGLTWTYHVLTEAASQAVGTPPGTPEQPVELAGGTLQFNAQGLLLSQQPSAPFSLVLPGSTESQALQIVFGLPPTSAGGAWRGFSSGHDFSFINFVDSDGNAPFIHCSSTVMAGGSSRESASGANPVAAQPQASNRAVLAVRASHSDSYYFGGTDGQQALACRCQELTSTPVPATGNVIWGGEPPTKAIRIRGNLDQTSPPVPPFDPAHARATSNFDTSATATGANGMSVGLYFYFSKLDEANTQPGDSGDWTYNVLDREDNLVAAADDTTPDFARPTVMATGVLRFDAEGRLVSNTTTLNNVIPWGESVPLALTFDFGTSTASGGSGLDGLVQYAASCEISSVEAVAAAPEPCAISGLESAHRTYQCWQLSWPY